MQNGKYIQKQKSFLKLISLLFLAAATGFGGLLCYLLQDAYLLQPVSQMQPPAAASPGLIEQASKNTALPLTDLLQKTKSAVYTIYTPDAEQGSGFLINRKGHLATNAHVVSGHFSITVKDASGAQYTGTVIGYSSHTDVALIEVPALTGRSALLLETKEAKAGDKVIAFGSPLDQKNTATFGSISSLNQNFVIEPYVYSDVYQTSAAIAPGSSGGPLISQKTGLVLAINAAYSTEGAEAGYSIPCKDVAGILRAWSSQPMSREQITGLYAIEANPVLAEEAVLETLPSFVLKDINKDGKRNFHDVTEDVNKDGTIDEQDLEELLVQYP